MRRRASKLDIYAQILGTASDRSVAERAGVSIQAVRDYRKRHNIPSRLAKEAAKRAAAPPDRPSLPPWMPPDLAEAVMDLTSRLATNGISTITFTLTTTEGKRTTVETWKVNL